MRYQIAMPADAAAHRVFVDYENVPKVDLELVAGRDVHVTLLIGNKQTRLPTALSMQLHRHAGQVQPIEVGASGRNALDLTLAFYLGQAVQQWPTALFHIVSRDRDFEPMIAHLIAKGIKVGRSEAFHLLPFLARSRPVAAKGATTGPGGARTSGDDRRERVVERLRNPANRNRPASRKALLAHLRAASLSDAEAAACVARLERQGILAIDPHNKVVWR